MPVQRKTSVNNVLASGTYTGSIRVKATVPYLKVNLSNIRLLD